MRSARLAMENPFQNWAMERWQINELGIVKKGQTLFKQILVYTSARAFSSETAIGNGSIVVFAAKFHQAQRFFANLITKRFKRSATALGLPVLVGRVCRMRLLQLGSG
jgi:hypothetical protein